MHAEGSGRGSRQRYGAVVLGVGTGKGGQLKGLFRRVCMSRRSSRSMLWVGMLKLNALHRAAVRGPRRPWQ